MVFKFNFLELFKKYDLGRHEIGRQHQPQWRTVPVWYHWVFSFIQKNLDPERYKIEKSDPDPQYYLGHDSTPSNHLTWKCSPIFIPRKKTLVLPGIRKISLLANFVFLPLAEDCYLVTRPYIWYPIARVQPRPSHLRLWTSIWRNIEILVEEMATSGGHRFITKTGSAKSLTKAQRPDEAQHTTREENRNTR